MKEIQSRPSIHLFSWYFQSTCLEVVSEIQKVLEPPEEQEEEEAVAAWASSTSVTVSHHDIPWKRSISSVSPLQVALKKLCKWRKKCQETEWRTGRKLWSTVSVLQSYAKFIKVSWMYQNQSLWALCTHGLFGFHNCDTDSAMAGRSRCRARCFGRMGGVKVG